MKNLNKVFVVSSGHNELNQIKILLKSLKNQTYKNNGLYFVDDGSKDGTSKYIEKYYPETKLLSGDGSLWWTGSIHLAIEQILKISNKNDYILTINSDCFFDKNYISNLLNFSKTHLNSIVGSVAIDPRNKKAVDAGVNIDWSNYKFLPQLNKLEQKQSHHQVDVVSTKGTLYPVKIIRRIGNFDKKNLPHYLSDYEYSCRANKKGYKVLVHHESVVYSDPKNTGYETENKITIKKIPKLLFSRKSKVNIFDHINFIKLCCPKNLKVKNYFLLFRKIFIN